MPFVERDGNGSIVSIHCENRGLDEYLPHDDADIQRFLADSDPFYIGRKKLSTTDFQLIRSIEDLILLLLDKDVITNEELPEPVQELLTRRQMLRGVMKDLMTEFGDM